MIQELIIETANKWQGKEEIRGNFGFKDREFERKMKAIGFKQGQSWCSYFAKLVWIYAYQQYNSTYFGELNELFNPSAVKTYRNFEKSRFITSKEPKEGALVVWQNYKNAKPHWTGHIGIVLKIDKLNNKIISIEGNTNDDGSREGYKVASKLRSVDFSRKNGLNLLGFVYPLE